MQQSQDGYLLIADITGYTAFLRESELEHAKDSLRSLLDLLIEQIMSNLKWAKAKKLSLVLIRFVSASL